MPTDKNVIPADRVDPGGRALDRISKLARGASRAFAFNFLPEDPPLHSHSHGQIAYSPQDSLLVLTEVSSFIALPATAVWIPPRSPHRVVSRSRRRMLNLYLAPALCASLPREPRSLPASDLLIELLRALARSSDARQGDYHRALALAASREAVRLMETSPKDDGVILPHSRREYLQEIARELGTNPTDSRGLTEWARRFGKSPKTLSRDIKRDLGMTFREWRLSYKMLEARERLRAGESVKSVSYRLGYANPNTLVAIFRRLFGVTPGRLRRGSQGPTRMH